MITPNYDTNSHSVSLCLILSILFLMISCQHDHQETNDSEDQMILDYLQETGEDLSHVKIDGDFIHFHECTGWDRHGLLKTIRGEHELEPDDYDPDIPNEVTTRQRGILNTSYLDAIKKWKIKNVKVYLHPSLLEDCGGAWQSASIQAMNEWNKIGTSVIKLKLVTDLSKADIIIGSDNCTLLPSSHKVLPNTTIAKAGFPSDGFVYGFVSINDEFHDWASAKKTIMHEIGHCVGFRHTGTTSGSQIPGTSYTDENSIMNQGANTNPYLTDGDKLALRKYYPTIYAQPKITSISKYTIGGAKITFDNPNHVLRPYYWVRVIKLSTDNKFLDYKDIVAYPDPVTGKQDIYWNGHISDSYKFAVKGLNFRKDTRSKRSVLALVTL